MRYLKVAGCVLMALVCGLSALATATVMTDPDAAGLVLWAMLAADVTVGSDGECD